MIYNGLMKNKRNFKINPLTLILLAAVVIIPIILIIRNNLVEEGPIQSDTGTEVASQALIPIQDTGKLTFDSLEITLPEGWVNIARYANQQNTNYECLATDVCQFGVVADSSGQLNSVTFSYINQVKTISAVYTTSEPYFVSVVGRTQELVVDKVILVDEQESTNPSDPEAVVVIETISNRLSQIYGCFHNRLCIASGQLRVDSQEENDEDVALFRELLSGLQISGN